MGVGYYLKKYEFTGFKWVGDYLNYNLKICFHFVSRKRNKFILI